MYIFFNVLINYFVSIIFLTIYLNTSFLKTGTKSKIKILREIFGYWIFFRYLRQWSYSPKYWFKNTLLNDLVAGPQISSRLSILDFVPILKNEIFRYVKRQSYIGLLTDIFYFSFVCTSVIIIKIWRWGRICKCAWDLMHWFYCQPPALFKNAQFCNTECKIFWSHNKI